MLYVLRNRSSRTLRQHFFGRSLSHTAERKDVKPFEELTLPKFEERKYCAIHPADILHDRYTIITKLGFGAHSTVWLARDRTLDRYASIKVCVQVDGENSPVLTEVKALQHLQQVADTEHHPGVRHTRLATDIFEIDRASSKHYCIVMDPQGSTLRTIQEALPHSRVPRVLLKPVVQRLLLSLNWLQSAANIIHTDISAANILIGAENEAVFRLIENEEVQHPSIPTIVDGYPVYRSRSTFRGVTDNALLGDFGSSRQIGGKNNSWWMSDLYRAPEVLLKLPWDWQVDMWSLGVMILELMEGKSLFDPIDRVHNQYVLPLALAQYIGVLGMPPRKMLEASPLFKEYFDSSRNWAVDFPITEIKLEDFVTTIRPGEEKELFLKFIRKLLTWDPEKRLMAFDAFEDEWIRSPLPETLE